MGFLACTHWIPALHEGSFVLLGGRSAEELIFGDKTTGAENDIEQATMIARNMVTRWGMSDKLGLVELTPRQNPYLSNGGFSGSNPFSEETARMIDEEVLRILKQAHEEALSLLKKYRSELDALASALIKQETLDEKEILKVTGLSPAPPLQTKTNNSKNLVVVN